MFQDVELFLIIIDLFCHKWRSASFKTLKARWQFWLYSCMVNNNYSMCQSEWAILNLLCFQTTAFLWSRNWNFLNIYVVDKK